MQLLDQTIVIYYYINDHFGVILIYRYLTDKEF